MGFSAKNSTFTCTEIHFVHTSELMLQIRWQRRGTLLDNNGVQAQFHLGPLYDPLLHCVFSDETKDAYLLLLTNPVSSVLEITDKQSHPYLIFREKKISDAVTPCF